MQVLEAEREVEQGEQHPDMVQLVGSGVDKAAAGDCLRQGAPATHSRAGESGRASAHVGACQACWPVMPQPLP